MDAHELFEKNKALAYWACIKMGSVRGISRAEMLSYAMETLFTCCKYWVPEKSKLGNYFYFSFEKLMKGRRCKERSKSWQFNSRMESLDVIMENTPESWCDNPVAFEEPFEGEMNEEVENFRAMRDRLGSSLQRIVAMRHNNGESFASMSADLGTSKQNLCSAYHNLIKKLKKMHVGEPKKKLTRAMIRQKIKSLAKP